MAVPVQVRETVSFQKDIYSTLVSNISHFRELSELCDINLKLYGISFMVHKVILAASSPYFRSMFSSKMKEERSKEVDLSQSLVLEHVDSFRRILDFVYTGELEINTDNVEDMLRIADFLLLDDVKEYCRQFYLQHGNLNLSNCLSVGVLAEHHNLPDVAYIAKNIIRSRFHDYFIHSYEILELPESILMHVLKDKEVFRFASSDSVIQAIVSWARRKREHQRSLPRILPLVPLQSISADTVRLLLLEPGVRSDLELVIRLKSLPVEGAKGGDNYRTMYKSAFKCLRKSRSIMNGDTERNHGNSTVGLHEQTCSFREFSPVLIAANCSSSFRYVKILVYGVKEQQWYCMLLSEMFSHAIPTRLSVCNLTLCSNTIYMYLSHCLPYPSDMLRIHILAFDISSGEHRLMTFRHIMNRSECCKTTLTDDRAVPPVLVHCRGYLCIVGNQEGTGHVFLCDIPTQTYTSYQIPGTRFVSLARAVVREERFVYIWCRHRFGHEEYCINKDVTFVKFDCKYKTFTLPNLPAPPGISYGEFGDPHIMCLQRDSIVLHTPGKSSSILDEKHCEWLTFHQKLPGFPSQKTPVEMPYHGYEVYTHCEHGVFVLQNPAAYTTSMCCLVEGHTAGIYHPPPPVDCISLITCGQLPNAFLQSLPPCDRFDETYTKMVHNKCGFILDYDIDSSDSSEQLVEHSESDEEYGFDGYEYDDDIYGFYDEFE